MAEIEWQEWYDDDDNSYWEGQSIYTSDGDPLAVPDIYWRLRQRLADNKIEWYEDHDGELMHDEAQTWNSLEEAKAAIQEAHDNTIADALNHTEDD